MQVNTEPKGKGRKGKNSSMKGSGRNSKKPVVKKAEKKDFDKYFYYTRSVQNPEGDVGFLEDTYKEIRGTKAMILREDFCGTFANSCAWVKSHKERKAIGVDLDPEPIEYGKTNYLPKLKDEQQKRVKILEANVLDEGLPKADVIAALNFSYFIFKERSLLLDYFKQARAGLKKEGVFILDCFGGSACYEALEEETEYENFSYFWDLDSYDPITSEVQYYIHFKVDGKKHRECFSYDWRMWSLRELQELLKEAGFKKSTVYWEGTTEDGEGDGEFKPATRGEECESWISYIAAEK